MHTRTCEHELFVGIHLDSFHAIMLSKICNYLFVLQTNKISRNNLVGYCEIDLLEFLSQASNYTIAYPSMII